MKHLLLFFLTLSAFSMTTEEINNLKIEDKYMSVCQEIQPDCKYIESIPDGTAIHWYDTIAGPKPKMADIENYFINTYIPRLIKEEKDRIAEEARVSSLKARWKTLGDNDGGYPAFYRKNLGNNPDKWFNDNLKNKDLIAQKMDEIEVEHAAFKAEASQQKADKDAEDAELSAIKEMISNIDTTKPLDTQKVKRILKRIVKNTKE